MKHSEELEKANLKLDQVFAKIKKASNTDDDDDDGNVIERLVAEQTALAKDVKALKTITTVDARRLALMESSFAGILKLKTQKFYGGHESDSSSGNRSSSSVTSFTQHIDYSFGNTNNRPNSRNNFIIRRRRGGGGRTYDSSS